jgi:hypothetical protein
VALAIDHEGTTLARRLQLRGIAAFVLKYRIDAFHILAGIPGCDETAQPTCSLTGGLATAGGGRVP